MNAGLEVIKLEFILRLKIKRNDWLLVDRCVRKQPIVALYFESKTVLKFYNLEAWALDTEYTAKRSCMQIKSGSHCNCFNHKLDSISNKRWHDYRILSYLI